MIVEREEAVEVGAEDATSTSTPEEAVVVKAVEAVERVEEVEAVTGTAAVE